MEMTAKQLDALFGLLKDPEVAREINLQARSLLRLSDGSENFQACQKAFIQKIGESLTVAGPQWQNMGMVLMAMFALGQRSVEPNTDPPIDDNLIRRMLEGMESGTEGDTK